MLTDDVEGRLGAITTTDQLAAALANPCLEDERSVAEGLERHAHCLSPAQAQIYCSSIGARLPTAEEWNTGLADAQNRLGGEFRAGYPAEWSMTLQHGLPAFFRTDANGSVGVPAGESVEDVGFRCAYTF